MYTVVSSIEEKARKEVNIPEIKYKINQTVALKILCPLNSTLIELLSLQK